MEAVTVWQDGIYRSQPDPIVLAAATEANLTLVTFDVSTIPPILQEWAESDRSHHGVVFIDERTIASNDFGAIARSLVRLHKMAGNEEWIDRITFIDKPSL